MARDLHGTLIKHQNELRDEFPWVWLYELEVPTEPKTRYRITNAKTSVAFGTNSLGEDLIYSPYPCGHGEITQNRKGDLPSIRVSIANASKELGLTLDQYNGMIGSRAVVRLINLEAIDDPSAQIRWDAQVTRAMVRADVVSFELSSYNIHKSQFPRWRYMSKHCNFRFGGPECGYVIPDSPGNSVGTGFDYCNKQYTTCIERGDDEVARGLARRHAYRYGGFRGIPGS